MTAQTILLVEDNALTRKMVRFALEKRGYAVLEATDGETALSLTESRHPDLILQDLVLPDVDGFDLVTRLRALPHGGNVSILAVSGLLSKFDEARIASVGFDDVIAKPIEPSRLIPIVEAHLLGPLGAERPGMGRRLILADDDPIQLKLTRFRLERLGFAVEAVADGAEALEAALRERPSGIVSDILMPRLDGFGLALAIRNDPRLAEIPVLLVTSSYVDETDRILARRSGANELVVRSPDQRELVLALRTVLTEAAPVLKDARPLDQLERERSGRVVHQLERQVTLNSGLARRCSMLTAELSVLTGISEAVVKHGDVEKALDEALGSCLEVGAISLAVLYLRTPGVAAKVRVLVGGQVASAEIAEFFGHPDVLDRVIAERSTVILPDGRAEDAGWSSDLLRRCGATFAALVPLPRWGPSVLFMAVDRPDYDQDDWRLFAQGIGTQIAQSLSLASAFVEKEKAERVSHEQTQLLKLILDGMGEGVIATDSDGRVVRMNRVASELTGWLPVEAVGEPLDRVFHIVLEESRERIGDAFVRALDAAGTGGFTRSHLLVSRSGRERPIELRGSPIHDVQAAARGAVVVFRDLSEAREAERALRESEQRFRSTFEQAAVGVAHVAPDGRLLDVNQRLCDILGYTRAELRSRSFSDIYSLDEGDAEAGAQLTRRVLSAEVGKYSIEKRVLARSGEPIWVELTVSLVRDELDTPKYLVAVVQDIAARKRAEEELKFTTEQLRQSQKMEAIGQLAGGVAHDFNNVLSVVLGYGKMILNDLGPNDALCGDVQQIVDASERAAKLTRQLLAFSRKQVLSPRLVDLNEVLQSMSQMLRRLIGEDVELAFVHRATGKTLVDPGQVEQVVMNLVVNARDAMPQGGKLTIETDDVTVEAAYGKEDLDVDPGDYVGLSVSDTGTGMDGLTRSRIFEPFFTTKEKGKGTGLGLSTVFGIVKQSGGSIWVYSELGQGTTFKIYLPRAADSGRERSQPPVATRSLRGAETILLVEDDPQVRSLAQTILQRHGYHVLAAMSGAEAVVICKQFDGMIHLLLTDVVMPGLGGRQLAEQLVPLRPRMRVIFMSGYTDDAIVRHGVLSSGLAFIQKPLLPEPLLRKVRDVLDRAFVKAES